PLEPAVVTVGSFHAGTAHNVIAASAELVGTVRAFDPALLGQLPGRVEGVIAGVCAAMGATYTFEYRQEATPTVNDRRLAEIVRVEAERIVGAERVRTDPDVRTMAAEDFGDVLQQVPGCYFFVGARNEERGMVHPHHSAHFDLCEDCMPVGVAVLEAAALRVLRGGFSA
ncbi:MAG TPA: M20/M25/M40 family metallo-hydrolase, partial [Longimicrobium sp.]|uniref:M20 metallopeptidase family protein n=1 Tax=Longimicrobium sp. TaxID=2029185 RepID=UPI002EDB8129